MADARSAWAPSTVTLTGGVGDAYGVRGARWPRARRHRHRPARVPAKVRGPRVPACAGLSARGVIVRRRPKPKRERAEPEASQACCVEAEMLRLDGLS